jgi:hypothetical protein
VIHVQALSIAYTVDNGVKLVNRSDGDGQDAIGCDQYISQQHGASSVFKMRAAAVGETMIAAMGDNDNLLRRSLRSTNAARINPDDVDRCMGSSSYERDRVLQVWGLINLTENRGCGREGTGVLISLRQ